MFHPPPLHQNARGLKSPIPARKDRKGAASTRPAQLHLCPASGVSCRSRLSAIHSAAWPPRAPGPRSSSLVPTGPPRTLLHHEERVADGAGELPVDLLGHTRVPGAQPCLHVGHPGSTASSRPTSRCLSGAGIPSSRKKRPDMYGSLYCPVWTMDTRRSIPAFCGRLLLDRQGVGELRHLHNVGTRPCDEHYRNLFHR